MWGASNAVARFRDRAGHHSLKENARSLHTKQYILLELFLFKF